MGDLTFLHRRHRQLEESLQGWWGNYNKSLITLGAITIIVSLTLSHYYQYLGNGTPPTLLVNNMCSPCADGNVPDFCELPAEYQFDKVIWFITDGYPMYMQKKWLGDYEKHSLPYTVAVPGKKWSHTIYTSWFTGMPNTNILARAIYGDSIFESMQRASSHRCSLDPLYDGEEKKNDTSYSIRWVGPTWCPVDLLGGADRASSELNFTQIDSLTEDLDLNQHPYPSLSLSNLPDILNDVAEKGQSLIAHTGIIDKEAHYGLDSTDSETFLSSLFSSPILRDFISANPSYLLILSSDHGRSVKGKFHGDGKTNKNGNIGMFTFYHPIFNGQNMSEIDVVDVHPTLAKYMKNVDISFYSVGEVRNQYGPNGQKYELNALKQNLAQLIQLLASDDESEVDLRPYEAALESDNIEAVRERVREIKMSLYRPIDRPFHVYTMVLLMALLVGAFFYWSNIINNKKIFTTLLLAIPLGFSFGFFLKPLSTYHFESNFTFYFGVATSFVSAAGFSEWRVVGYLVLNEFFNWCGFLFRNYLSHFGVIPFIGILLSLFESLYHFNDRKFRNIIVYLHLLNFLFLVVPSLEIFGFHVCALIIYLFFPLLILLILFMAIPRVLHQYPRSLYTPLVNLSSSFSSIAAVPEIAPSLLILGLTSISLLLFNGSPLVALVNFQARQILPCLFGISSLAFSENDKKTPATHIGLQACVVYVLQQALWMTWLVWGITPDLEVDVKSGVPGIHSWNEFPVLAGFLLGMQKLGPFPLLALHIGTTIIPNVFSLFILSSMTVVNCLSIHFCLKKFQFKFQIEALLVITLCTFLQLVVTMLIKFSANPQFQERAPWAHVFCNQISYLFRAIKSKFSKS